MISFERPRHEILVLLDVYDGAFLRILTYFAAGARLDSGDVTLS